MISSERKRWLAQRLRRIARAEKDPRIAEQFEQLADDVDNGREPASFDKPN